MYPVEIRSDMIQYPRQDGTRINAYFSRPVPSGRSPGVHSCELLACYVMPQFRGTALGTAVSNRWAYERYQILMAGRTRATERARQDYAPRHA